MSFNLTLIAQAVAFALFIWFTVKFVWPPLLRAIEARQKQVADGLAAAEQDDRSLSREEDVEQKQHRHQRDGEANSHALVAPATWPETSSSATGASGAAGRVRTPMSMKLSRPFTTPVASRAAARAIRTPGAYAVAGSTVSCTIVSDSPGPDSTVS